MTRALCLSAILLGGLALQAPPTEAERLWASMLEAKGGREKLEAIHSVVFTTKVAFPNFTARDIAPRDQSTLVVEFPDCFWDFTDYRPGKMGANAVVWNGPKSHVWAWPDGQRSLDLQLRDGKVYRDTIEGLEVTYLLHTRWVDPKPLTVSAAPGHWLLHATWKDMSLTYRVDASTRLPASLDMRREIPNAAQPDKPRVQDEHFDFEAYSTVSGIKLPGRVKFGSDWGTAAFLLNPELDPRLFDRPIDPITSPDAWRKFLRGPTAAGKWSLSQHGRTRNMALYAFDGTSNDAKTSTSELSHNTNVVRFFSAYKANSASRNLYVPGVGTRFGLLGKVLGGAFGVGELARLHEAYDHLCRQWAVGDRVIDIVGFSRGAATTLDFCNLINKRGICSPGSDTVVEANPQIRFVGVWDVVAAFGLANLGLTDFNFGHHLFIPKTGIQYAFHALALDERRPSFLATRLGGAYEVWFRGVHADVGGGNGQLAINNISLKWMMCKARAAGLPITDDNIAALETNPMAAPSVDDVQHELALIDVRTVFDVDRKHYSVESMPGCRAVPDTCLIETAADEQQAVMADALSVLTPELADRVTILASIAAAEIRAVDFPFGEDVQEALVALIHNRIPLVTNDDELLRAREAVIALVNETVQCAQGHQFHAANEFFLSEALQALRPIFPFVGADE